LAWWHARNRVLAANRKGRSGRTGLISREQPDDCRLRSEREGERVRLITKGGYDWTKRNPRIVEAARKNRHRRL
jgi:hypothetical protein